MLYLSVGIVALNEESFLPIILNDLVSQTYDHSHIEVLLIDSGSTDKTKSIMIDFKQQHADDFKDIKVLDNPKKIQSAGWNVAIRNYSGDSLTRIDAHSRIDTDFLKYVKEDLESGENVVGGIRPCVMEKDTKWSQTLLQVENSLFGSSILNSRSSNVKQYVKTMFHATYRREVLDKVGLFNEQLLRTEDNEFHYRVSQQGYQLCYDPRIVSYQYARGSFKRMIKQKYGNGLWIGKTVKKCPKCLSLYHFVPFVFVLSVICTSILIPFGWWWFSVVLWGMYFLFAIVNTLFSGIRNKFTVYHLIMPFLFLTLHVCYGVGTAVGLVTPIRSKKQ